MTAEKDKEDANQKRSDDISQYRPIGEKGPAMHIAQFRQYIPAGCPDSAAQSYT
jgi:hypothetical protein